MRISDWSSDVCSSDLTELTYNALQRLRDGQVAAVPCRSILRQLQVSQPQNATYHIIARIFRKITSPKQSSKNEGVTSGRARHRAGRGMIVGTGLTIFLLPALYSRWFRLVAVPAAKQKRS